MTPTEAVVPTKALKWRQFREWLKYHLEPFDHQHFVKSKQRHLFTVKMKKLQSFCTPITVQNEIPNQKSPSKSKAKSKAKSKNTKNTKNSKNSKKTKSTSKSKSKSKSESTANPKGQIEGEGNAVDDASGVHSGVGQSGRRALHCWCLWLQIPQKDKWLQLIINDGNWFTNCTSEMQMMGHETKVTDRDYWFLRVVEGHSSKVFVVKYFVYKLHAGFYSLKLYCKNAL